VALNRACREPQGDPKAAPFEMSSASPLQTTVHPVTGNTSTLTLKAH
jgi:hypothetical protein